MTRMLTVEHLFEEKLTDILEQLYPNMGLEEFINVEHEVYSKELC